jgi:putative polyketide hydroxylase
LIRQAIGLPDLEIRIQSILPWEAAVRVAETFQQGRIFLAGDAAHQMPPWGGKGANSGIADVHNLAWKLAAVLKGRAAPALLQTYDVERRPVGYAAAVESGSMSGKGGLPGGDLFVFQAGKAGVTADLAGVFIRVFGFGYEYASQAVIPEEEAATVEPGKLDGHPGTRAPHVWIERQGQRISTLDLFGRDFVLLSGPDGEAWCEAARAIAARSGLNLVAYRVGPCGDVQDTENEWSFRAGIQADGALLVRPDGFVAWRSQRGVSQPEQTLEEMLGRLLAK